MWVGVCIHLIVRRVMESCVVMRRGQHGQVVPGGQPRVCASRLACRTVLVRRILVHSVFVRNCLVFVRSEDSCRRRSVGEG
jgi:hypothetical protein